MAKNNKNNKVSTNKQKRIVIPKNFLEQYKITPNARSKNQFQKIKTERPDAVEQTLSASATTKGVPYVSQSNNSSSANIVRKDTAKKYDPVRDYYRNKKTYDERLDNYIAEQREKERFEINSKIADQITSDPNYITKSAAPMDNTIVHFNKPLQINDGEIKIIEPTSTEIPTLKQQLASLSPKPLPETTLEKVLTYAPTAIAAAPIMYMVGAGGAVPLAQSIIYNPISWGASAALGELGSAGVNSGVRLFTDYNSWGDMLGTTPEQKFLLEFTNPGGWFGGLKGFSIGNNIEKRAIETAMRTSSSYDGMETVIRGWKQSPWSQKRDVLNYILFNKKNGQFYNTLSNEHYTGLYGATSDIENDIINAYLYGTPLDERIGKLVATGEDFGPHTNYIKQNYPDKAKNIRVYEATARDEGHDISYSNDHSNTYVTLGNTTTEAVQSVGNVVGLDTNIPIANNLWYNAGGHLGQKGILNGNNYFRQQDIWKFNAKDYMNKWIKPTHSIYGDYNMPLWKKILTKWGLNFVDAHGTPIIIRTPWRAQESELTATKTFIINNEKF